MTREQVEAALRTAHIDATVLLIEATDFNDDVKSQAIAYARGMYNDDAISPLDFAPATLVAYEALMSADADDARLNANARAWATKFDPALECRSYGVAN
jgi:hypothetical protein